jgi:hypothetical protein
MKIEYSDYAIKEKDLPLAEKGEPDSLPLRAAETGQQ